MMGISGTPILSNANKNVMLLLQKSPNLPLLSALPRRLHPAILQEIKPAFHPGAISAAIRFTDSQNVIEATKLHVCCPKGAI